MKFTFLTLIVKEWFKVLTSIQVLLKLLMIQERGDGVNDYREFLEDTGVPEIIAVAALDRVCRSVI